MVDLGTLGGKNSSAAAISDNGLIVGSSNTASGESHATLWKLADTAPPTAQVSVIRTRRVMPDASVDSIGAAQQTSAMLTWSATLSDTDSNVLPAPRISVDGSSWTFVPPVTFPLSVSGPDLQQYGMLNLTDLQGAEPFARRRRQREDRVRLCPDDVAGDDPAGRRNADSDRLGDAPRPDHGRRQPEHPGGGEQSRSRRGHRRAEHRPADDGPGLRRVRVRGSGREQPAGGRFPPRP